MKSSIKNSFVAQVILQSLPLLLGLFAILYAYQLDLSLSTTEFLLIASILIPARILDSRYLSDIVDGSLAPTKWQVLLVIVAAVLFVTLIYFLQGWRWDEYTKVGVVILSCMFIPVTVYAWLRVFFEKRRIRSKNR